jgi:phage tail-like protein
LSSYENPGQNLVALLPETGPTGEIFNLDKTGEVATGQLRRYLQIFGPKLDEMKGLVDAFPTMIDVDTTDSDLLPLLGELVGVKFNREIPIPQAREEIKQAVQWYKRKGTLIGSRIHGYKVSRLQTDIVEFWKNIKTAVTLASTPGNIRHSFAALGPGGVMNFKLPGDKTAFSYDYDDRDVLKIGMQFASSETPLHEAWRAISDREDSSWKSATSVPAYWGFEYPDPILPLKFRIKAGLGLERFKLQWSDDALGPWTDVGEYIFGDVRRMTQCPGSATGSSQTMVLTKVPITPVPDPVVYEIMSAGALDTELTAAADEGTTILYLRNVGGLNINDWLELSLPALGFDYFQVKRIEGSLITIRTAVTRAGGWPPLTPVKQVNVSEKVYATDYTIDNWEGIVTLLSGQFTAGNNVFLDFKALIDKNSINIRREFAVNTDFMVPHKFWRLYIEGTWDGDPELTDVEFFPDQFYGNYYRADRLGYFFTLGNARPGCRGRIICNRPLLQETVQKLCNTMREAVPVCVTPVMTFVDCHYPERFDITHEYADSRHDEINTRNRELYSGTDLCEDVWRDVITSRLLISTFNPTPLVPNPATQYSERGSPTYITGSPLLNPDGLTWISMWVHP